ncbi:hypothetical protein RIR_jg31165.t1 [Rhizophagus irregularis DAOM 181602=DAOM 197198]|nr:hypothetical protein RIR_jg31165.t1 [Rhizophagus irregularis DAOM 181602=DAOM 197198]
MEFLILLQVDIYLSSIIINVHLISNLELSNVILSNISLKPIYANITNWEKVIKYCTLLKARLNVYYCLLIFKKLPREVVSLLNTTN